jgi:hypothetical protein
MSTLWPACCSRSAFKKAIAGNGRLLADSTVAVGVGASGRDAESIFALNSSVGGRAVCAAERETIAKKTVNPIAPRKTLERTVETHLAIAISTS